MNPIAPPSARAERLEIRADLAVRLAVVHRLERGCRHEEERHAGLGSECLGQVRLAGAWGALEQHAPPRRATELVGKTLVLEEEVEGVNGLALGGARAHHVGEADVGVRRSQQRVRGAAGTEQRNTDQQTEEEHEADRDPDLGGLRHDVGNTELDGVVGEDPVPDPGERHHDGDEESTEAASTLALPRGSGIGFVAADDVSVTQLGDVHLHTLSELR